MAKFLGSLMSQWIDEKLPANPMQGFLKELIFVRYIGHDEIPESNVWRDCSQCWICERWDKAHLEYMNLDAIEDQEFQKVFEISRGFND
jgi:hypothetical protein